MISTFVALMGIGIFAFLLILMNIKALLYICQPNEVLILAGTTRKTPWGPVGYRLVHGGRALRMPLIERAHKMDLTNMIIDIKVHGAYSKGGIPLDVSGMANIKVASTEPLIGNAIQRFLDKDRNEIKQIAKETLEGNLRGVLATLTPEEVNQDRIKFAQNLLHEADHDLSQLGIVLDTLKIQSVSDEKGYLDCLGRKESARLAMQSRVAEADNEAVSKTRKAENMKIKEFAKVDARIQMAKADMDRRVREASTRKEALAAEERTEVVALIAKAESSYQVETERVEQVKLQLEADRIKFAEAKRDERVSLAKGQAAHILENGQAVAQSIQDLGIFWNDAGKDAFQIFFAQKIDDILPIITQDASNLNVKSLNVYGEKMMQQDGNLMGKSAVYAEHIKRLLGTDFPGLLPSKEQPENPIT